MATRHAGECVSRAGNRVRRGACFSNPQRDRLRQPARPYMRLQTMLRRLFSDETNARKRLAAGFPKIERVEQTHWRRNLKRSVILLLGDEGIDHGGVLVPFARVFLILMRHGMILVIVTGVGVGPVAVIHRGDLLLAAAVTQIAAMQAKRLCPADREQRDEAKSETLESYKLHNGQRITSLRLILQPRIQSAAVWRCFSSTSALRIFTRFIS